jgi:hypothetical protein
MATPAALPPMCYGCLSIACCPIASDASLVSRYRRTAWQFPVADGKVSQIEP